MNILDHIVAEKRKEIAAHQLQQSLAGLEQMPGFQRKPFSLKKRLAEAEVGIIAEFKRRSPSKGDIFGDARIQYIIPGYAAAGASGISVLTDEPFFGGQLSDLQEASQLVDTPLLRKDFIVDTYQLYQARAYGASVVLLIAECLEAKEVQSLAKTAKSLELEVLFEVHSAKQLEKLTPDIDLVGVNNRNLKTFEVSLQTSIDLFPLIPSDMLAVAESGISKPEALDQLRAAGFRGFLIGEHFMRFEDPGKACADFMNACKALIA